MRYLPAQDAHQAFYTEFLQLLDKHLSHLSPPDVLAVTSVVVGKLIAMQDATTMTPQEAIAIVQKNIEAGNAEAITQAALRGSSG